MRATTMSKRDTSAAMLLVGVLLALGISGVSPFDRGAWLLEVFPVIIALPLLLWSYRPFPLTMLVYGLIALHALVLIYGGAYTYARVPLGFVLQDWLDLARNPYDRIGHLAQGFVPAMIAREILLRTRSVAAGKMLAFLCVCVALAISAFYELVEWWVAVGLGDGSVEFLATQGDPWDTQWDMFYALVGAVLALLLLSRWHDRQLGAMPAWRG